MSSVPAVLVVIVALTVAACGARTLAPAPLDTRHDACAECRMTVSNARFASQIVAPGEEPLFFDDLGCLAAHLRDRPPLPEGAIVYVADHRTREWAVAGLAVYTKAAWLETPMGSHVVAHASAASRDADTAVQGGERVDARSYFAERLPGGRE
jgi:copper chaperone NosL